MSKINKFKLYGAIAIIYRMLVELLECKSNNYILDEFITILNTPLKL